MLPEKIGPYKIVEELGRGGMGVVYKAFEESLNRHVAIKVLGDHLAADEQFLSRFMREARAAGSLSHPNVIPIYTIGNDNGLHYFAMEFVAGRSVQSMIRSEGRIGNPRAAQIIVQAAHGLAAAHDKGIIHRDIKPANLMVDERGVVKIADFGIALPAEAQTRLTATGALMGTPGYLSPEHCLGEPVDHRADIYALGVTYYEMLTGRMPFNAESPLALLRQILQEDPPDVAQLNSEVDAESRRILMKMIARNRDERYQTCHELIADLEEYLATKNVRSVTSSLATRSQAAPYAASTPTVIVDAAAIGDTAANAKTAPPKINVAAAFAPTFVPPSPAQVTAPGNPVYAQPATQPGQVYVPPPQPAKKRSLGLIIAIVAVVLLGGAAAAALVGYKVFRSFRSENASVLPLTTTSSATPPQSTTPVSAEKVELTNPQTITQPPSIGTPAIATVTTAPPVKVTPVKVAQVVPRTPAPVPQPVAAPARHTGVAFVVQGESGLNGAIADVISSELSSAGLQAVNADDLPATEGMAGSASSSALVSRLRDSAGTLVVARVEPTGQRELSYMGRHDTAYGSRVTITVFDVATGRPIGPRNSASIEYTQLNAQREAEKIVGPLAQKAAEAIRSH